MSAEGSSALDSEALARMPSLSGVAGEWDMLLCCTKCFDISLAMIKVGEKECEGAMKLDPSETYLANR